MTRLERTTDYLEKIKLECSYEILKEELEKGKESGQIYNLFFWDGLIYNNFFRIEWLKKCGNDNPFYYGCFWDFEYISDLTTFKIEWYEKYPDEEWEWDNISNSDYFDISWVTKYPDKDWNWDTISGSANFDISWVNQYPDKNWYWDYISGSRIFDISWVNQYPDKDWYWYYISCAPNFDISWVNQYPDKPWDWDFISSSANFDISWVNQYPDKNWYWDCISASANFDISWVNQYPDKNWNWYSISRNKNCKEWYKKAPFIYDYMDKSLNISNKSNKNKIENIMITDTEHYQKKIREYMAAYKIQQWWKYITISPYYKIGRKFINKKYDSLFNDE